MAVRQIFDFSLRGRVRMKTETESDFCSSEYNISWFDREVRDMVVVLCGIVFVSIAGFLLHAKALWMRWCV